MNTVNAEKKDNNIQQIIETESTINQYEHLYKVSDFKGKLAVYEGNSKIPYKVYNLYINSLPESDQILLKNGIYLNSFAEVKKIIEEYTS